MQRKVLVPTDGSPFSHTALEYAIETFPDGAITLVHVVDPRYTAPDEDRSRPERVFTRPLDIADRHGIAVDTEVLTGRPAREIVRYSQEHDVDEIVLGSHGREAVSRALFGSVAEHVLRRATVPVTVVRPKQRTGSRHHLVPIDGSDQSERALEYALTLFPEVQTTVLHAIDPMETHYGEGQLVHSDAEYEQLKREAEQLLADAVELAERYDGDVTTTIAIERGPNRPADAILSYVADADVDHVIVGSHGRTGVSRLLLGSVAETVARRSPAPVTVVR
jgi:nucleotide-binding universal stress UspA family protein